MNLPALIQRIATKQRARAEARATRFRDLVYQVADGHEPDAAHVDSVLQEAGMSTDDLRQAVEQLQHRRQLRAQLDRLPQLHAERRQIEKRIVAANQTLDDAEHRHADTVRPLEFRLAELREATWAAETAKGQLHESFDDPEMLDQLADVRTRLANAHGEASRLRTLVSDYRDRAKHDRGAADQATRTVGAEDDVDAFLARAKVHERKACECEERLTKVTKVIAGLERQEAAFLDQMLVP